MTRLRSTTTRVTSAEVRITAPASVAAPASAAASRPAPPTGTGMPSVLGRQGEDDGGRGAAGMVDGHIGVRRAGGQQGPGGRVRRSDRHTALRAGPAASGSCRRGPRAGPGGQRRARAPARRRARASGRGSTCPTSRHHRYNSVQAGPSGAARRASPAAVRSGSRCTTATWCGDTAAATGESKWAHATPVSSPSSAKHGRTVQQPVESGVGVVHVPGHGELGAVHGAARHRRTLEHGHAPPGAGQQRCGHEAVGPRPDDHCVDVVHRRPA